jgi:hypothetical protein
MITSNDEVTAAQIDCMKAAIERLREELAEARDTALEDAAKVVDFYMSEGGFKALTAAQRVRAMKRAQREGFNTPPPTEKPA